MIELVVFVVLLLLIAPSLGYWMVTVFEGRKNFLYPVLGYLERFIHRIAGIDQFEEMTWGRYLKSLLKFNAVGFLVLFLLLIFQGVLPLNPQNFKGLSWDLAFNTTASFVTNTNWQSYSGEATLSYASQMLGLAVQNFLSAATGMTALLALIR